MNPFKNFSGEVKAMFSAPQTPASQKPALDSRRVWIATLFIGTPLLVVFAAGFLYLKLHKPTNSSSDADETQESRLDMQAGSLVINFKNGDSAQKQGKIRASTGTLVRVRLLNAIETFDTVPAFVQVSDYSIGQSFYGWTIVGDASGDASVNRIKMNFKLARSPNGTSSFGLGGQALSFDGTLGIKASKVEGLTSRAIVGSTKSGTSSLSSSVKGNGDLSSLLLRALLQGLETEANSDLSSIYNRANALSLDAGQEFFVQLTENF